MKTEGMETVEPVEVPRAVVVAQPAAEHRQGSGRAREWCDRTPNLATGTVLACFGWGRLEAARAVVSSPQARTAGELERDGRRIYVRDALVPGSIPSPSNECMWGGGRAKLS